MLTIRLARVGAKKKPSYRVVVTEKSQPRDGRFVEVVGHYDPSRRVGTAVTLKSERIQHWLRRGAQPSDTVRSLLRKLKVL